MALKLLLMWAGTGASQSMGHQAWHLGGAKRMSGSHVFGMGNPHVAFIDLGDAKSGGANSLGEKPRRMATP